MFAIRTAALRRVADLACLNAASNCLPYQLCVPPSFAAASVHSLCSFESLQCLGPIPAVAELPRRICQLTSLRRFAQQSGQILNQPSTELKANDAWVSSSVTLVQPDAMVPLKLPPKARLTDVEHPCGKGKIEWPFDAKAFYVGKELRHRVNELLAAAKQNGFPHAWSKESPLLCLKEGAHLSQDAQETGLPCEIYIAAFDRMQSIVFINGEGREKELWQRYTGGQLTSKYTEESEAWRWDESEFRVSVMPGLGEPSVNAADYVVLEQAEFNNIRTLSYVLAQTVALHFYETQVDRMLRKFEHMNVEMERSSSFRPAMSKEELLQTVARNNLLFTDIISKLGVMERFDVAWKHPDCNTVYEHLLHELEIEDRYQNLQLKLNLVQDNFRYFLELIQNQKSDLLEWIIIILIGGEISLNLYELFLK